MIRYCWWLPVFFLSLSIAIAAAEKNAAEPTDTVSLSAMLTAAETAAADAKKNASVPLADFAGRPLAELLMEIDICDGDGKKIVYAAVEKEWQIVVAFSLPLGRERGEALAVNGKIESAVVYAAPKKGRPTLWVKLADVVVAKPKGKIRANRKKKGYERTDIIVLADLYRAVSPAVRPEIPLPIGSKFVKFEEKVDSSSDKKGKRELVFREKSGPWKLRLEVLATGEARKNDTVRIAKSSITAVKIAVADDDSDAAGEITVDLNADDVDITQKRKETTTIVDDFKKMRGAAK